MGSCIAVWENMENYGCEFLQVTHKEDQIAMD